ncbi:MAG TPA: sulfite exporter TauE/SafE family protein [Polyangiaceae bacterium LLY-WYZ-15_(1-7)]|nr:sulfite exporter TauE/SafE family protein [Polyangiaceae bacterium LLY-WYZ-15_(1-7)]HJL10290.1 sulfite exporter TauE/SafE family protein [Polyangiaceae bacterium LLY-WYZ-15_(1-7)]HJL33672.1 sulfite exporter TauE/SafE family protein [Polyangiaceae bacterium LLY-WYZ-15_(1-7)]HJL36360.1 sulfite exporter TauE/SafE family protein [Polyangiaceae bacterium LLY-WYZ-15_(1-7)]HJL47309.1 sulfite exporter TauE/SafE family protein [Polyangiaceae bacterium LLY-WYZ-15_(1-7)]
MLDVLDLSALELALCLAMMAIAALVQGTVGFGFAIVSVPVLSLVNPALAPVPQLLVQVPLSFGMFLRERRHADWGGVWWTTLGRLPGTLVGVGLLTFATPAALDGFIGLLVLAAVIVLALGRPVVRTRATELGAGVLSGAGAFVSAIGGPPIALLYKDADGATVRATLALIFAVGVVLTVGARALAGRITGLDLGLGALSVPMVLLGFWASRFLTARVEGRPLRVAILGISALAALGLLGRAVAT